VPRRIAPENFGGSFAQIVSVGSDFWGVVTARGELWICGDGTHGCFGCWDRKDRAAPTLVRGAWGGSQVLMLSCGRWHTVAVTVAGMVWTWGEGFKLGHGDLEDQVFPIQIAPGAFGDSHMVLASAEAGMTMAVTRENILHVWGTGHTDGSIPTATCSTGTSASRGCPCRWRRACARGRASGGTAA